MEIGVASLRAVAQLALAFLVGGATFLLICQRSGLGELGSKVHFLRRLLLPFWLLHLAAAAAALTVRAALVAGDTGTGRWSDLDSLAVYALGTHPGRIATLAIAVAVVMVVPLALLQWKTGNPLIRRTGLVMLLGLASGAAVTGPLAGHAAADEATRWLVPIHMAHPLAMSIWLGGLPFWIAHVADSSRQSGSLSARQLQLVLVRFSRIAMGCMLVLIASGTALAWVYVDDEGDLLGTRYGISLCSKILLLVGVLWIAKQMRSRFLPVLAAPGTHVPFSWAVRWVSLELALAVGIAAIGAILSQTAPAIHDQPVWPLWRRLSIEATWSLPGTALVVSIAGAGAALAAVLLLNARRQTRRVRAFLLLSGLAGVGTALWKLSVPAYPDTFRRSTVPYLTVSIAQGMEQFPALCAGCHGDGGLGDGPIARALPKPPANLSEPHTALHTAGDLFWWMTHGIPESGMPGFSAQLDEQARWDMINFLRAFSQGFQARILDAFIVPGSPWLGAPIFYFEDGAGALRELKDYRERSNVLLVFPQAGEKGLARAHELSAWAKTLRGERTEVLLVSDEVRGVGEIEVVRRGGEIRQAYDLLSRTIPNRGDGRQLGMQREHMEFLIDRFGYVRARWIPQESSNVWLELDHLLEQARSLNGEPRILPPPDDHVH